MRKPVIGIMPLYDDEKASLWMLPAYYKLIRNAGGIPMLFTLGGKEEEWETLYNLCDGLLFTGGHDVDPGFYDPQDRSLCGAPCVHRDNMESYLFHRAWRDDKPILGICRGMQLINVLLGGDLYEDLPTRIGTQVNHNQGKPYEAGTHRVQIAAPLQDLLGEETMVNSLHHQAVCHLAKDLQAMAQSDDGVVEAAFAPNKTFMWLVQWHPEVLVKTDSAQNKIAERFIDSCL